MSAHGIEEVGCEEQPKTPITLPGKAVSFSLSYKCCVWKHFNTWMIIPLSSFHIPVCSSRLNTCSVYSDMILCCYTCRFLIKGACSGRGYTFVPVRGRSRNIVSLDNLQKRQKQTCNHGERGVSCMWLQTLTTSQKLRNSVVEMQPAILTLPPFQSAQSWHFHSELMHNMQNVSSMGIKSLWKSVPNTF